MRHTLVYQGNLAEFESGNKFGFNFAWLCRMCGERFAERQVSGHLGVRHWVAKTGLCQSCRDHAWEHDLLFSFSTPSDLDDNFVPPIELLALDFLHVSNFVKEIHHG